MLIRIDSMRPPVLSPNVVPRSYTRLNSTYLYGNSTAQHAVSHELLNDKDFQLTDTWVCAGRAPGAGGWLGAVLGNRNTAQSPH